MTKNKLTKSNTKIFKFFYGFYINGLTCFASQGYILKKLGISRSTFKRFITQYKKEGLYNYEFLSSTQTKKFLTEKGIQFVEQQIFKPKRKKVQNGQNKRKVTAKKESPPPPNVNPQNRIYKSFQDDMIRDEHSDTSCDDCVEFFSNPDRKVVKVKEEDLFLQLENEGFKPEVCLTAIAKLRKYLSSRMQCITNILKYLISIAKQVVNENRHREKNWSCEEAKHIQKTLLNSCYKEVNGLIPFKKMDKGLTFDVKSNGVFIRESDGNNHFLPKIDFQCRIANFYEYLKEKSSQKRKFALK